MWLGLVVYFALVGLRVALNYGALRRYLKLPLIERPAALNEVPGVEVVLLPDGLTDGSSEWLLFTTQALSHKPDALELMVRFAVEHHAPAVAVILQERCARFWEQLLLPFARQQSFASQAYLERFSGHELLIERSSYELMMGEDRPGSVEAILDRLRAKADPPILARGERLGNARSYKDLADLWAGAGQQLRAGGLPTLLSLALSILAIPCAIYGLAANSLAFELAALVTWVTSIAELGLWQFLLGAGFMYALLQPLTAVLTWATLIPAKTRTRG